MSMQYQAPALSPSYRYLAHRYLTAVLLRWRRFINRSVAHMLANRERAATQFMSKKLGEQEFQKAGPLFRRVSVRAVLFGLIVAGALSPAAAKFVHDHRGGAAVRENSGKRKPVDCLGSSCNEKKACTKRTFV
ncbi:hypothetical protein JQ596_25170 [Bradyrhizobium manausense]|uniref:hypothetical protein n=1 Tax=Bradyrhizobium TaxID=374 RepID=UPI001BA6A4FC|nr:MULTISPECIES: hypothetical protein [Bradyrhizobium]MBR0828834.1 hypothetical protein [Bradyrhizobium manausense]UVO28586.1 hypothetical protein KUF59_40115 [Bradyrhizobium arachidis]